MVNLINDIGLFFYVLYPESKVFNHHIWATSWKWCFEETALGSEKLSGRFSSLQPVKVAGLWNVIFLFISFSPACSTPDSYPERISADLERLLGSCSEELDLVAARFFSDMVDHSVLIVFASLGAEWLALPAQWFLWNIWEFREDH